MLQITKQGNSIVVEGLNHYFYPYNGTLEVPCNSVITIVDDGDIVLFRSAANYDVLFSAKIDEITINGETVTKENVGDKFGALSNTSSGGMTPEQEEKLNNSVQISDYNADKATQTTIDEAQTAEINKLKGDIAGKQDIIQDLNAIREGANLGKTALQEETDPIWTAEKGNYYTKTESDGKYATQVVVNEEIAARINDVREVKATLESKADKSEIPTVPTNVSAFTNDAGYLTEHQSLNNYYTKSEVNTSLETKADKSEIPSLNGYATEQWVGQQGYLTQHQSLDNYYTKSEVNTSLESKADKTEIPSLNGYATKQWVGEQGYLTEHQQLKTINGETIVGNGNIEIASGEETDPVWTAEKVNYYTKTEVNSSLESKADKSEIPTVPTNVSAFTNDAGYLTEHQTLKTINGETIVGNGNIEITSGEETDPVWTAEKGNYYTKTEVNSSLETKANKSEIPSLNGYATEQWVGQQGYLTQHQSLDNYYTKSEIDGIVGNVNNALGEIING